MPAHLIIKKNSSSSRQQHICVLAFLILGSGCFFFKAYLFLEAFFCQLYSCQNSWISSHSVTMTIFVLICSSESGVGLFM